MFFEKFNLIFSVRDVKSLLDIYPFNKYLVSSAPKPFQIVFPKQVKKKGLDVVSTREHQISHHVSLWTRKRTFILFIKVPEYGCSG